MPFNSFEDYPMSWRPKLNRKAKPLYLFIANQLEVDIKRGILLPGTKLPPQRELADFLDINLSTVSKAFKVCELKGLVSATIGSGTYVSYDALSNAYLLGDRRPHNIVEMGATIPEPDSYESLIDQLSSVVRESEPVRLFSYSRGGDQLWQKDAAVKLMQRAGYNTNVETILFANGGQNAITAILVGLCKHGDKIGVDTHTYPGLKTAAGMLGIQLIPIRQKNGEMDAEALAYACKSEGLKGIYLVPDYQNPTTHRMSLDCRREIARVAKKYDIFIIEDAAYHLMCKQALQAVASFASEQTIYIASLSKTIGPGLRLAYVSASEKYKKALADALYNINISVSPLMSELAARIIVTNQIDTIIEGHRRNTIYRNQQVNHYLAGYDCHGEDTCIFRWLKLPSKISGAEFEALASEEGVQVYAADRFVVGNSIPEAAVRLSITAPETSEELNKGLILLKKLLDSIS